ncbi:LysR family transcriptional regulator [Xanthomonas fragariae]|uniref:Chromosome replication initiation inhibitor protein n=1 Tax=Xanthomonas fragariae TaxID=48664 RepID=A0A1Y6H280_9XANT|nr:LysR family transcriptional regulator [Xanthomonas fragariae]SMR00544.1 chromosome replication initiation inhibitor protein [Xanthomonas fragariae]SMR02007.1 LysR family transcriptional regulator [Xanthomonas fragariae]
MDLSSLSVFVAIAENGSFSAGEALHLTQPAVSKRIALLESLGGKATRVATTAGPVRG